MEWESAGFLFLESLVAVDELNVLTRVRQFKGSIRLPFETCIIEGCLHV